MPRIRSIHPDACTSEKLAAISGDAERCYWRLQTHCDDEGRAEDHPRLVWAALFPLHEDVEPRAVDQWLRELDAVGLIIRYEVAGRRYLAVTQWDRFQHPQRPRASTIPEPDTSPRHVYDGSAKPPRHVTAGVGEGEGEGEGEGTGDGYVELALVSSPSATPVDRVFLAWQAATGHKKAVLDKKRRAAIVRSLAAYPAEDLIDACHGVMLFAHNRGETNGTRYDDLCLVLRDAEHIERFRDRYRGEDPPTAPRMPKGSDMTARNLARLERPNGTS